MKVVVDGAARAVSVINADDLKSLSVALQSADGDMANNLLAGFGWVDGQHAWLDIDRLRSYGPIPRSDEWDTHFAETMAWAKENGWTEATGQFVRAHIEEAGA